MEKDLDFRGAYITAAGVILAFQFAYLVQWNFTPPIEDKINAEYKETNIKQKQVPQKSNVMANESPGIKCREVPALLLQFAGIGFMLVGILQALDPNNSYQKIYKKLQLKIGIGMIITLFAFVVNLISEKYFANVP